MMARILAIAFLLSIPAVYIFLAGSAALPCPFETTLMGNPIHFPMSMGEFQKIYPTIKNIHGTDRNSVFRDSQEGRQVEWLFRSTLAHSGAKRPLYGVNIFLPGHPEQLDSIAVALEKQFKITLVNIGQAGQQPIYSASLNGCTTLFVCRSGTNEYGSAGGIRISISNHLSDEENQYFSTHSYNFEPEID